ncbi:MAG: hypothetical protein ACUVWR_04590 [Anaerolineae bacterium]
MRVYREFVVDENTRTVEVRCIDESTGREVAEPGDYGLPWLCGLDWVLLAQREIKPQTASSVQFA